MLKIKYLILLLCLVFLPNIAQSENLKIEKIIVNIEGMSCSSCVQSIEKTFSSNSKVDKITVNLEKKTALITPKPKSYLSNAEIRKILTDLDYQVKDIKRDELFKKE